MISALRLGKILNTQTVLYSYTAKTKVKCQKYRGIVNLGISCLEGYRALEPEVAAASTNREGDLPGRFPPALGDDVPDGEVVAGERERDGLGLPGLDRDRVEALEDGRGLAGGRRVVEVELRNLRREEGSVGIEGDIP